MRIPVNSEADAFRLVFASVAVIAVAFVVGALTEPLIGAVLLGGAILGALLWELLSRDPDAHPLRDAAAEARGGAPDARRRVLVVANETVRGRELRDALMDTAGADADLRVVCPILPSRAHYIASDIDHELAEARERLEDTLAWSREHGIDMTGRVSEETPLAAIADELRAFPADEVIVSTHPRSRSKWLESGLVDRLRDELDVPVRHVVVDLAAAPAQRAAGRA